MRNEVKDLRIETARGLAALLVVAGHVIGPSDRNGLHVGEHSWLRYLYEALLMLRLPLFTVLSGYVYAMRPVRAGDVANFLSGKARRILLPMLSMGALFLVVRAYAPGVSERPRLSELALIPFYPHAHFWYLQTLFVVFVMVTALEVAGLLKRFWTFAIVFAASGFMLESPLAEITFFSISRAAYLLIFFLWGLGLNRFADVLSRPLILITLPIASVALIAVHELGLLGMMNIETEDVAFVTLLGGLCTNAWLVYRGPKWSLIGKIGHYSFSIYLMHVFGTAASRVLLKSLGVTSEPIHLAVGIVAGLLAPIAAELVLDSFGITRFVFLGRELTTRVAAPSAVLPQLAITGTLVAGVTALPPAEAEAGHATGEACITDDDKRGRSGA